MSLVDFGGGTVAPTPKSAPNDKHKPITQNRDSSSYVNTVYPLPAPALLFSQPKGRPTTKITIVSTSTEQQKVELSKFMQNMDDAPGEDVCDSLAATLINDGFAELPHGPQGGGN